MKKLLLSTVAATALLTSCVIESYEKPKTTVAGYVIFKPVHIDICQTTLVADITRVADLWYNAASAQEKFDIEDKYLGTDIKIREYEDKIIIMDYYKIENFGKPLSESKWRINPLSTTPWSMYTYEVSSTSSNEYHINILNRNNESLGDLTLNMVTQDKEYLITGSSKVTPINSTVYYDHVVYEISSPVKIKLLEDELIFPQWLLHYKPMDGEVDIKTIKSGTPIEQNNTTIKYNPEGVEVSHRGFKDLYTHYEFYDM